jgi:hypothetical protein
MKLYRKILAASVLAVGFGGCLKDDSAVINPDKTINVVEFKNTAPLTSPTTSKYGLLSLNVIMQAAGTYNAMLSYSGPNVAPEDLSVTLGVADPAVLAFYNTQNKTTYTALPTANFALPKTTVVIPKGERTALVPMNFINTDQIFGKNYVLALSVTAVSGGQTIGNYGTILYLLSGINKQDGIYELHFKMGTNDRGYDVTPVSWYYSDIQMVTASATTSTMRNLNAGTSITSAAHAAATGGLPAAITTFVPVLTFDATTNKVTAVANNTTTGGITAVLNPAVTDSRYDPATNNIYVSFIVKQSGKLDMIVYDTLFYKTPR